MGTKEACSPLFTPPTDKTTPFFLSLSYSQLSYPCFLFLYTSFSFCFHCPHPSPPPPSLSPHVIIIIIPLFFSYNCLSLELLFCDAISYTCTCIHCTFLHFYIFTSAL
ncbi:MAG: hypothetical protein J3R72DRAFT_434509 [Linnemannia gamsii]|nr:MAG: hypothetical protein J3R72DRAFT_434509 [Linnemannia gamsii]